MELIFEIIQALANVAVIVGVFIAIRQLFQSKKNAAADLERREKEATMAFTFEVLKELDKLNPISEEYSVVSYEMYMNKDNKELHDNILQFLRFMERICVGINTGVYDFNIFQRICGWRVWKNWCAFESLVYEIRERNSCNALYIEYEKVADRIGEKYKPELPSNGNIENKV